VSLMEQDYTGDLEDETADAESRELTHEEIWDDSALIEAWDAAMNEYRAFHGSENKWKAEPISNPSPLWHNVPPGGSGPKPPSSTYEGQGGLAMSMLEHDSIPLNFNTFVPSHDPALPNLATTDTQNLAGISQDEAFRNVLNAMYWTGYWTAVYHCRGTPEEPTSGEMVDAGSFKDEPVGGVIDEFVTSQR